MMTPWQQMGCLYGLHFAGECVPSQAVGELCFSLRRQSSLLTLSTLGGTALPPTPMRWQSMRSPSSRKVSLPTTTPFSEATTAGRHTWLCSG